jgi:hypothetical protein
MRLPESVRRERGRHRWFAICSMQHAAGSLAKIASFEPRPRGSATPSPVMLLSFQVG